MMMELYDEQEILKSYVESEKYDVAKETAIRLLKMGKLSVDEVAAACRTSQRTCTGVAERTVTTCIIKKCINNGCFMEL